jgi:DNA-binding NarL/FixJ family response regulator
MGLPMLRILIADDHDIVRQGMRAQLAQRAQWQVCGEAHSGSEAVRLSRELKPDIVVMDLSIPELNGVEATRQIRGELARTEVLIFTEHEREQMIREAVSAGARGCVLKTDPESHLVNAIEALARRKPYFTCGESASLREAVVRPRRNRKKNDSSILTAREREVLQLLTEGKSNKDVAIRLGISVKTVETHRSATMRKLDMNSIVALVHYAIRNQIVEA